MKRVMIVGGPGSGKSTLARELGARAGLPVYHMDHIHWKPDWQPRDLSEKIPMARTLEARNRWIIEGSLSATYDSRAARADTLIWLDFPVGVRLWRVTWRTFVYWGRTRPDLPAGCVEGLHGETAAFYRWIWQTRHSHKRRLRRLCAGFPDLELYHLTTSRQVAEFLKARP